MGVIVMITILRGIGVEYVAMLIMNMIVLMGVNGDGLICARNAK